MFTSQLVVVFLADDSYKLLVVDTFLRVELGGVVIHMRLDIDRAEGVPGKRKRHYDLVFEERIVVPAAVVLIPELLDLFPLFL